MEGKAKVVPDAGGHAVQGEFLAAFSTSSKTVLQLVPTFCLKAELVNEISVTFCKVNASNAKSVVSSALEIAFLTLSYASKVPGLSLNALIKLSFHF